MKKGKQNIVYIDLTQDAESLKNCSICTNDLPASEFVKCTAKCQHEFCKKCIKHYLEAEINSKMYKEGFKFSKGKVYFSVHCLEINCLYGITRCPHKMGFEEITQLAAKKGTFSFEFQNCGLGISDSNRYETLLLRRTLQNIKGFTWYF